jgi:hypothetical protein
MRIGLVMSVALLGACAMAGEETLFDFEKNFDAGTVDARDVNVTVAKNVLQFASGHKEDWPGITLKAPQAKWDLSKFEFVTMNVKNAGAKEATVCCRVDNAGADGSKNCNTGSLSLAPGETGTLQVVFKRKAGGTLDVKLFGMRGYPAIAKGVDGATIDPAAITQLLIFVPKPKDDQLVEIGSIRAGGSYTPPPQETVKDAKSFFPFIDTFGQYVHADWPGKTHSAEELKKHVEAEEKDLKEKPGPEQWDQYGGWKNGPSLEATGFFRVQKHEGKWWLVDPEGKLFWSHGVDCVNPYAATPIDERKEWFQDFPGDQPEFKTFLSKQFALHGYYKGKTIPCFDFGAANLLRKYGDDWKPKMAEMAHKRLRSWGMNTIANWSDSYIYRAAQSGRGDLKTPYTATVGFKGTLLEGSEGYWGKFRDVFDPSFKKDITAAMAKDRDKVVGDPWCLGIFVDNEIAWGDETSLAVAALQSPAEQAAKKVFVEDLKAKYGDIVKLNEAWATKHESWDALLQHTGHIDAKKVSAAMKDDLRAFYTKTAETYFSVIRDAVKGAAPKQLYLGCRFAWVNPRAVDAAAKFCDVVSYNLYQKSIANFKCPAKADVPLLVGEFHFGALDRGMFHTGLVALKSQEERAKTYKDYVQGALRHPQFVGTHWFQYKDEATTGRPYDEENYQIGLVDNVDTPYAETIQAVRDVGYGMYEYRLGKK